MSKLPDSLVITGSLTGVTNLTGTGDLTIVDMNASGCVTGTNIVGTGDLTIVDAVASGCVYAPTIAIDALSTTNVPTIVAASYAPGATNLAYPGSLWIRTSGWDLAAGSPRANGMFYVNTSASNATGSSWTILNALSTWEP